MVFNVKDFGAVADGKTLCTKAFNDAIAECAKTGGYVDVPAGEYVSGTIELKSHVVLRFEPGAVILADKYIENFTGVKRGCSWGSKPDVLKKGKYGSDSSLIAQANPCPALIKADNAENCGLEGPGVVNGRRGGNYVGSENWENAGFIFLCVFSECKNIFIKGVSFENPGFFNVYTLNCTNVNYDSIKISSRKCPCGDGLDFDGSKNVTISNCIVDAGDDAIGLKTLTPGEPCENFTITNCVLSSVWAAVRIGPETGADFRNINISNCVFNKCNDGFKIQNCEDIIFEDFCFSNISMINVMRPVFMTLNTYVFTRYAKSIRASLGKMRRIKFSNISARQIQKVEENQEGQLSGNLIYAMQGSYIEDVSFTNVTFAADGGVDAEDCKNPVRPELLADYFEKYPEALPNMGNYPSAVMYIRNAKNIKMENCDFFCEKKDSRPAVLADGAENMKIRDCDSRNTEGFIKMLACKDVRVSDVVGAVCEGSESELKAREKVVTENAKYLSVLTEIAAKTDDAVTGKKTGTYIQEGSEVSVKCGSGRTFVVLPEVKSDIILYINDKKFDRFVKIDGSWFTTCFTSEVTPESADGHFTLKVTDGSGKILEGMVEIIVYEK